ncbi:hypothetical protein [Rhodopseudomonas sp. BAL398]|uniref:hypothetical protein n=1 Tax=Rhodopseudomonas sp. BAL398 TaxID=3034676 RepID=UPI0023E1A4AC|nr:hypothetical protein [Rhodopseudomonas sp. BAL398]MDF3809570.1 hypothetical protein [Rhodopseudomonas sp. BAL398]
MTAAPDSLQTVFDRAFTEIGAARAAFAPKLTPHEVGRVVSIATGIAKVSGLPGVGFEELVAFPGGVLGIAFNVDEDEIGVVLLGDYWHLNAGDEVRRTGRVMDVLVGDGLLGRVIDPLGRPLDGNGTVAGGGRGGRGAPRPGGGWGGAGGGGGGAGGGGGGRGPGGGFWLCGGAPVWGGGGRAPGGGLALPGPGAGPRGGGRSNALRRRSWIVRRSRCRCRPG